MSPQAKQVLNILKRDEGITLMTAAHYGVPNLSARLSDLKEAGYVINREQKKDLAGKKYSRWTLSELHKNAA